MSTRPLHQDSGTPADVPRAGVLCSDIALWGDSLTDGASEIPGYAPQLCDLYPSRTVYDGGIAGETSTSILRRVLADRQRRTWVSVFWMGRNNLAEPLQVKADIAAAIAHLGDNSRFLVLSILNSVDETLGTPRHSTVLELNDGLVATYPGNVLDIRSRLIDHFDPSAPRDVAAHEKDVIPPSLSPDGLHLNVLGCTIVADGVRAFIDAKDW